MPLGMEIGLGPGHVVLDGDPAARSKQVAQLSQRDRATHELLRFAKLRSGIFEPPFLGGLGET